MSYIRKAWQLVSQLSGQAKVWATNNIGKIVDWLRIGTSPISIVEKIKKITGN